LIARIYAHLRQPAPHRSDRDSVVLLRDSMVEIARLREIFRINIIRLAPDTSHEEIDRVLDGATRPQSNFDDRLETKILAAQLRLRVHVEVLANRAQRDIQIETHHAMRDLFKSIKYGVHHAEI
jgi:hypothetical protein